MPRYGTIDRDYGRRLATCEPDQDGPIYMLNLMKYRDEADYGHDGERGVSGREADDRYAPRDVLTSIGAAVCFVADVVASSEAWDRIGVVRYPTRRSFIEMQARQDFQERHVHKDAGMDHTIVLGTLPTGDGLPGPASPGRMALQVWRGDPPLAPGVTFTVEGIILGDGRGWDGVRYSPLGADDDLDVTVGTPEHQVLVLQPVLESWHRG